MRKLIEVCDELKALSSLFSRKEMTLSLQEADGISIILRRIEKTIRKYVEKKADEIRIN